jgi:hypothetical protein
MPPDDTTGGEVDTSLDDARQQLRGLSAVLLEEIADLRLLEFESRSLVPGSPEFMRLSREIEEKARHIFALTGEQLGLGERVAREDAKVDDVTSHAD